MTNVGRETVRVKPRAITMSGNKKVLPIVTIMVRVTPRADRDRVAGMRADGVPMLRASPG